MSRIAAAFAQLKKDGKKGFIPFIVAGDPDLATTADLIIELSHAGATAIELGVPFSDPMADGPVIQRASERALRHRFGIGDVLEVVSQARQTTSVPIVLFSYFNPLLQFGIDRLAREAGRAGVDGVLVTDLAPEEAGNFASAVRAESLDLILLVAPTSTSKRLQMIAERASGFIYAVSRAGVTGTRDEVSAEAERLVARLREVSDLPVAVGFGISNAQQVADVWRYADAAVVGSAIVAEIEQLGAAPAIAGTVGKFARNLLPESQIA